MKSIAYFISRMAIAALLLLPAGSCTDTVDSNIGPELPYNEEDPVVFRASEKTTGGASTRADKKFLTNRTDFLFSYPSKAENGKVKSLPCEFDENGYGYVYVNRDTEELLKWKDINWVDNKAVICLDNLTAFPVQDADEEKGKTDNYKRIEFGTWGGPITLDHTHFKPYIMVAPATDSIIKFDGEKTINLDILAGRTTASPRSQIVMDVHHKMSKVTFCFTSKEEELVQKLGSTISEVRLEHVKKYIYNYNKPTDGHSAGFNRYLASIYSTTSFNESIDHTQTILQDAPLAPGKNNAILLDKEKQFFTPTYFFPPHNYYSYANKAKLTIDLGHGDVYSGNFPLSMEYTSNDGSTPLYANMAFLAGYHLTINVELINKYGKEHELRFHGILINEYIEDFTETDNAPRESGIYSWSDYETVVNRYNILKGPKEEDFKLYKYGTWNENTGWTFYLWDNIVPKDEEGQIPKFQNNQLNMQFNKYHMTVKLSGTDKRIDQDNWQQHLIEETPNP